MIVSGPTTHHLGGLSSASDLQNGGRKARRLSSLAVVNLHCQGLSISVASEMIMSPVYYYGNEQSLEFGSGRNGLQSYISRSLLSCPDSYHQFGAEFKLTRHSCTNQSLNKNVWLQIMKRRRLRRTGMSWATLLFNLTWAVIKKTSSTGVLAAFLDS
ncbi:unnamed protein product [Fusarium venenatum]|uniref:Uncharacterized protein n=1 Tax=Fusarium venenatum TaxID=56646 RepID=A0A2L2T4X3_9HYPO|nr:uncharacterized protein FVRRES_07189 [Fusarium venenatum]CEI62753.1 unnamed protein product [Fusarium venenatum]